MLALDRSITRSLQRVILIEILLGRSHHHSRRRVFFRFFNIPSSPPVSEPIADASSPPLTYNCQAGPVKMPWINEYIARTQFLEFGPEILTHTRDLEHTHQNTNNTWKSHKKKINVDFSAVLWSWTPFGRPYVGKIILFFLRFPSSICLSLLSITSPTFWSELQKLSEAQRYF